MEMGWLKGAAAQVFIFLGSTQKSPESEFLNEMQQLGPAAEYIKIEGSGPNALDFHIAYYIGRLAANNPGATFQIISKDKGFDPLIKHLKGQGVTCHRVAGVSASSAATKPQTRSKAAPLHQVIENLRKRGPAKPRTKVTLLSTIKKTAVGIEVADETAAQLYEELKRYGVTEIPGGKIQYAESFSGRPRGANRDRGRGITRAPGSATPATRRTA